MKWGGGQPIGTIYEGYVLANHSKSMPTTPPPNATISSTAGCAGRSKWPLSGISDRHAQLSLGLGTLEPDSVQVQE